jgi:hypothetical protein
MRKPLGYDQWLSDLANMQRAGDDGIDTVNAANHDR